MVYNKSIQSTNLLVGGIVLQTTARMVITIAYKKKGTSSYLGPGKKKKSKGPVENMFSNMSREMNRSANSKKHSGSGGNSRKTHDTKGKNNHGRTRW